jgi:hypothetical protein
MNLIAAEPGIADEKNRSKQAVCETRMGPEQSGNMNPNLTEVLWNKK